MNPTGKPSKEQLEQYFKMSRQYFDELAKRYKETDKPYYDQYIAPFYGPFANIGGAGTKPGGGTGVVVALAFIFAIVGVAGAIFVFSSNIDFGNDEEEQETLTVTETTTDSETIQEETGSKKLESSKTEKEKTVEPTEVEPTGNDNYSIAERHFNRQEWEEAQEYYKMVPESDPHYDEAYIKLLALKKIIEMERKSGVKMKKPKIIMHK